MKPHSHLNLHPRDRMAELTLRLRKRSLKITGPRQAILEILRHCPHPMTTREVLEAIPGGNCDRVTIYRSMHLLEKMGMVKRFDFGDGVARFELLNEGDDGHHHHLVCVRCSQIVEIEECFPPDWEKKIANRNGFQAVTHKLEFFGICPRCQSP